jgi:hypothetical protein
VITTWLCFVLLAQLEVLDPIVVRPYASPDACVARAHELNQRGDLPGAPETPGEQQAVSLRDASSPVDGPAFVCMTLRFPT